MALEQYIRHENPDGTITSVCLNCFAAFAHTPAEDGQSDAEQTHTCGPVTSSQRLRNIALL